LIAVRALSDSLREHPGDPDLEAIATYVGQYIDDSWESVL